MVRRGSRPSRGVKEHSTPEKRPLFPLAESLLPIGEQAQRRAGRELIEIEAAKGLGQGGKVIAGGLGLAALEESKLWIEGRAIGRQRMGALRFEVAEDLSGARQERSAEPGQPRDMDTVRTVRGAFCDLVQEHDV